MKLSHYLPIGAAILTCCSKQISPEQRDASKAYQDIFCLNARIKASSNISIQEDKAKYTESLFTLFLTDKSLWEDVIKLRFIERPQIGCDDPLTLIRFYQKKFHFNKVKPNIINVTDTTGLVVCVIPCREEVANELLGESSYRSIVATFNNDIQRIK